MFLYLAIVATSAWRYRAALVNVEYPLHLLFTTSGNVTARAHSVARVCDLICPESIFMDSGAFSIRSAFNKHGKKASKAVVQEALRNHLGACAWLNKRGYPIHAAVEMDLPDLYGIATIKEWREKLMFPFQEETNVPAVFVPHGDEYVDDLMDDRRVRYIGVSTVGARETLISQFGSVGAFFKRLRFIAEQCYERDILFHGFGVTKPNVLKKVPFYSCDSISWQRALHFGEAVGFDQVTGETLNACIGKEAVKTRGAKGAAKELLRLRAKGSSLCPLDAIGRVIVKGKPQADFSALMRDQIRVFSQMETYYSEYWRLKGFVWKKPEGATNACCEW